MLKIKTSSYSDNYLEVRKRVYGWALAKRLGQQSQGNPGGIDAVSGGIPLNLGSPSVNGPTQHGQQWGGGFPPWDQSNDPWGVDAVGKGKGAFKGGKGYYGGKAGPWGGYQPKGGHLAPQGKAGARPVIIVGRRGTLLVSAHSPKVTARGGKGPQ